RPLGAGPTDPCEAIVSTRQRRGGRTLRTTEKQIDAFIEGLERGLSVHASCTLADMGRQTAYDLRQRDEAFALRWADAIEDGTERLEDEAERRALESSDTLLIFLLKSRRPEKYRDNVSITAKVEHRDADQSLHRAAQADPEAFERMSRLLAESEGA
ncbi:MAG: hypothetical protein M3Q61_04040, partial [Chloroflexota bacterium]|nr:hypothetical protein [Chloroflexota bacterium]